MDIQLRNQEQVWNRTRVIRGVRGLQMELGSTQENIPRHDLSLGSQQQYDALAQERCSLWGGGQYKGEAHPAIVFIEIYSQQSFGTGSEGSRNVARLVVRTIR